MLPANRTAVAKELTKMLQIIAQLAGRSIALSCHEASNVLRGSPRLGNNDKAKDCLRDLRSVASMSAVFHLVFCMHTGILPGEAWNAHEAVAVHCGEYIVCMICELIPGST